MKRIKVEGRSFLRDGVLGVGPNLKLTGILVAILWAGFLTVGFEWIDGYLLLGVGIGLGLAVATMFLKTPQWTWRAVGLFWVLFAITVICIPAGVVQLTGDGQIPFATRALWRAMAIVGAPLFVYWLIDYHRTGGERPASTTWDGINRRVGPKDRRKANTPPSG